MAKVAEVASVVIGRHGDDFESAERPGGWVNATWLTQHFAIRVGIMPGTSDLLREAELAKHLPNAVGYPETIEAGLIDGHEYQLTHRIAGVNLAAEWPNLDWDQRAEAIQQLWCAAENVHGVPIDSVRNIVRIDSPLYASTVELAMRPINRLEAAGLFSRQQVRRLGQHLGEFYAAVEAAPRVLNHGDLWMGNAVWNANRVAALLDFEYAVLSPVELDLNELVKHAFAPPDTLRGYEGREGDDEGLHVLRDAITDMVAALPPAPTRRALLVGYSILLESWMADRQLDERSGGEVEMDSAKSYRLLSAIAEDGVGFLSPVLR